MPLVCANEPSLVASLCHSCHIRCLACNIHRRADHGQCDRYKDCKAWDLDARGVNVSRVHIVILVLQHMQRASDSLHGHVCGPESKLSMTASSSHPQSP